MCFFFFSSRRRHTRCLSDWSSDVCSSDLLVRFRGEIEQVPPMYAAIKHEGRPLYAYARRGESVERAPRRVAIRRLELESFERDAASLHVECSKGTYIRTLAEDIGEALGCGAHLAALERLVVGPFSLEQAVKLEAFEAASATERRGGRPPPPALAASSPPPSPPGRLAARGSPWSTGSRA